MKKMAFGKRLLALLLVVAMLFAVLPQVAFSADATEQEVSSESSANESVSEEAVALDLATSTLWEYKTYGTGVELTAYNGTASDIYVPATVDGKAVIKLADSLFENNDALNSVTLAEGITEIGARTFYDADQLVCIVTNETLTTIGAEAFYSCDSFNSVILYDGITTIGNNAFAQCPSLTIWCNEGTVGYSYAVANSISYEILNPNATPETYIQDGITYYIINGEAIAAEYGGDAQDIVIPAEVKGNPVTQLRATFEGYSQLYTVTLPETVYWIGDYSFYNCINLRSVNIPQRVNYIGVYAFYNCYHLTGMDIPYGVSAIKKGAFYKCSGLANITIPESVTSIEEQAFYDCTELTGIWIPDSVTHIGGSVFYRCRKLATVRLPQNITELGGWAFYQCEALKEISIPASVYRFSDAFRGCSGLISITIPEKVTLIDSYAFEGCSSLTEVTILGAVTEIGSSAFDGCTSLKKLKIPSSVKYIWTNAFSSGLVLVVEENSYAHTFAQNNDCLYVLDDGINNLLFITENDILYYVNNGNAVALSSPQSVMEVTIPAQVQGYPVTALYGTFEKHYNLISVQLPDTLKHIGKKTFYDCQYLKSINFPDSVETIGQNAFTGCAKLTSLPLPKNLKTIENNAFSYCSTLVDVTFPAGLLCVQANAFAECNALKSIVLPEGLEELGYGAFNLCKALTDVKISGSVKLVGERAFLNCSALQNVEIAEGVAKIGNSAFTGCTSLKKVIIPKSAQLGIDPFPDATVLVVYENSPAHTYAENDNKLFYLFDGINVPEVITEQYVTYAVMSDHAVAIAADSTKTRITVLAEVDGRPVTELRATFRDCKTLQYVTLPASLITIGEKSFYSCTNLRSIQIPDGVQKIDKYAFTSCSRLVSITIPQSVTSINGHAFSFCAKLKNVTLPQGITVIADNLFYGCDALTSITIPDRVVQIGEGAFGSCDSLTSISIPAGVTKLPAGIFANCKGLKAFAVHDAIQEIEGLAFNNCTNLEQIIIPKSVRSIGSDAFVGCDALKMVYLPESVQEISESAFPTNMILMVTQNSYSHRYAATYNKLYFVLHQAENPDIHYGAGVSGTVTYTDGTVASGASVEILYDDGTLKETVTADADGAYAFTYAEVGRYTVRATDAGGNTASAQVSVKRMNAFDVFRSGDTDLTLKKAWSVSGTVSASSATVTLTDEDGNVLASTETADGSFALTDIPNGTYVITATTENGSVSQEVTVFDSAVSDLLLTVTQQAATVWGYVEIEDREFNHHRRNWVEVTIYNSDGIAVNKTRSESDGKYEFTNLPPDEYTIVAQTAEMRPDHKGKGYDRSYTLTGYAYVDVQEATTYQAEDIVLYEENDCSASITGKVTAQGERQACEVILRDVFRHEVARYETGKNGKYAFKNISDGLYIITAVTESDGMGYTVVAVRGGYVYGETDIKVYKSDKIKNREAQFHSDLDDCTDRDGAHCRRARIAEEKRFYDSLSQKEKKQLSKEYVRRLNELIEWAAACEYEADEGVTVQEGGLAISGAELEAEHTVTFSIDVQKREKWETSTDGVNTREDYIQHEMEDRAGDRDIHTYYEITMSKTVDGQTQSITSICKDTETTGKFRITMEIPEEHRGYKHYSFIHVHHGESVELVDLDDDPNTVTFEVDRFSTFALVGTDEEKTEPIEQTNEIISQPQAVTTDSGNDVQFSVVADGEVVSYKWQYRKIYKWFDTYMDGYNTDTLTVAATGQRNGYDYRCVVTFADGTELISEPAELTVKTYMNITYSPNDQVVVLGYKGQFTAKADGEGIKFQWQYKRPNMDQWYNTLMEGATKPTVYIETTTARDGYQYRCQITDVTGNVKYTEAATMRVLSFTDNPDEAFAAPGEKVQFTVGVSVTEGFTYQWQYRRSATAGWTNTSMTGFNTATLTVDATTSRNGYEYRCVLTGSKNSEIASSGAVLHVGDPVVFNAQPQNATVAVGEIATFTVDADNAYAYQWQFYNPLNAVWKNTSAEGNQTANLNVTVKKNNNNYQYRCIVYGLDGEEYISDPATLTIGNS